MFATGFGLVGRWLQFSTSPGTQHVATAALITLLFAASARWMRGVSLSGALAGAAITFVLYLSSGWGGFAALVSVFVLAFGATRLGYSRKQRLGTAEKKEGRSWSQVIANLGVGTAAAWISWIRGGDTLFLLAMAAAFAEAAADTVSSECGQAASQRARMITTWETVPAGTDGGITLAGTLAGSLAALLVSLVCAVGGLIPWNWAAIATAAAILGMLIDSLLGATLERRKILDNDRVNFLGTLSAAILAVALVRLLRL
jgi:uncharacterized protein (TIGR00297 family)